MINILLLNLEPEASKLFLSIFKTKSYNIDSITFSDLSLIEPNNKYNILFVNTDFNNNNHIQILESIKIKLKECDTVFVFDKPDKELTKKSYLIGDGSIILPMESEKLSRIIEWYISANHLRRLETRKHQRDSSFKRFKKIINQNKIFILIILILMFAVGAIIGIYGADQAETNSKKINPYNRLMKEAIK